MVGDFVTDVGRELIFLLSRQNFPVSILTTLVHAVVGLSIAVAVLLPMVYFSSVKKWDQSIGTVSVLFNTVPALAWILLLVATFGVFSSFPVILTVALTVVPILLPTANNPVKSFLIRMLELAKLVNASAFRRFRLLILPSYGPLIFTYVRAGLGFAVKMAMVAEAFTATSGFGSRMMLAYSLGNTPQLIALSALAVAFALGVDVVGRRMMRWKKEWNL